MKAEEKQCTKCKKWKSVDEFPLKYIKSKKTGEELLRSWCKVCFHKETYRCQKILRATNPLVHERHNRWRDMR
jgi:hypothetical protein